MAFGWDLDRYLFFGGYPGAAPLVEDEDRWRTTSATRSSRPRSPETCCS
jgi:hypothetical protein